MNYAITLFIFGSVICSIVFGKVTELSNSVLSASGNAVQMVIGLSGAMALWGGVMQVAKKAGLTDSVAKLLKRPVHFLFPAISSDSEAFKTICMNLTANLLGLGNAATPLGIKAMTELAKEINPARNTAMLVVLNTSSIQLIPITVATLRMNHGSDNPWDCTLPIIIVSLISVIAGCIMISAFYSIRRNRK